MKEEPTHIFLDVLDLACKRNIGKGYKLDKPGKRGDSSRAPQWYVKDARPMLVESDGDQCIQASQVNSIERLGYKDEALEVARKSKVLSVCHFRDLSSWIQENIGRYQISTQKDKRKYE